MFLLDTDVLFALRRRVRNPEAVRWVENQRTADLHISVVTVGEIERGITQQERENPPSARELALWLDRVMGWYSDRILPVDVATARRLGAVVGDAGTRRRGLAHCCHGDGARTDGGHQERAAL